MKSVVSCLLVITVISCCSPDPTGVKLRFEETACANPWGASNETSVIAAYLQDEGVHPIVINRKKTSEGAFCEACICPNGWTIFIVVNAEDEEKARALGFY